MKKLFYPSFALLSLVSSLSSATEQSHTGSLTVQATVVKSCLVNTNSSGQVNSPILDFGTITSLTKDINASTNGTTGNKIGVLCSNTTPWSLSLDGGKNSIDNQRRMSNNSEKAEFIPYNLYTDASRSSEVPFQGVALTGTGNGQQQTFDIYGRIPAGSALPSPGSYIDTVTITVTY